MKRHDVLEHCSKTEAVIKQLRSDEWAGWIVWLLESLDDELDRLDADRFLKAVHNDLHIRIEEGRW